MGFFKERLAELFAEAASGQSAVPAEYLLNHLVCDFAETIRWWTKHRQYTPEEISAFFFASAPVTGSAVPRL